MCIRDSGDPVSVDVGDPQLRTGVWSFLADDHAHACLSLIHISEPTRLGMISYAVFCRDLHLSIRRQRQKCIRDSGDPVSVDVGDPQLRTGVWSFLADDHAHACLSLIHISEPTRLGMISYAVFC